MSDVVERGIPQQVVQYYDLYVPVGARPLPLLVALHGYGGDKSSMMRAARRAAGDDRFAIASLQGIHQHVVRPEDPEAPLGYGFGWATNFKTEQSIGLHHNAILRIIDELAEERIADPSRVFLFGFSQAAALNFRFAFTYPTRVRGVVAVCGGIPGDWTSEGKYRSGDVDVLVIAGMRDEYYAPERVERNTEALRSRARSVELRFFDTGHAIPREANPEIRAWLEARL